MIYIIIIILFFHFRDLSGDIHAAGGGVGQGMRDAAAVADDIQAVQARFQVLVHIDFHVVEFDLDTVKQGVVVGRAGGDAVKGVNHFDNAVQDALEIGRASCRKECRSRWSPYH